MDNTNESVNETLYRVFQHLVHSDLASPPHLKQIVQLTLLPVTHALRCSPSRSKAVFKSSTSIS